MGLPILPRNTIISEFISIKKKTWGVFFFFNFSNFSRPTIKKKFQLYVIFSFGDMGGGENQPVHGGSYNFLYLNKYILLRVVFVINFFRFFSQKKKKKKKKKKS